MLLSSCPLSDPSSSGRWLQKFSLWDHYTPTEEMFQPAFICQVSQGGQEEKHRELRLHLVQAKPLFFTVIRGKHQHCQKTQELELFSRTVAFNDNYLAWFLLYDFLLYTMFSLPLLNLWFCASVSLLLLFLLSLFIKIESMLCCLDYLIWSALYTNSFWKYTQDN